MIKKCTLCGGRLSNGKCEFCGLDNTLYDPDHLNDLFQTSPTGPTSAKGAAPQRQAPPGRTSSGRVPSGSAPLNKTPSGRQWKSSARPGMPARSPKKAPILVLFIAIAVIFLSALLPTLFRAGGNLLDDISDSGIISSWQSDTDGGSDDLDFVYDYLDNQDYYDDYDPYSYVTREIPQSGDSYETVLGSGSYIVGIHIPEGVYTAELNEGSGSLHITDEENIIYEYIWFGDDEEYDEVTYQDDIRLYNGARIDIDDAVFLNLTTDNAQPLVQETTPNPLAGSDISVKEGTYIVGEDLETGIYDLFLESGPDSAYSSLDLVYPDGSTDYLWMNNSSYNEIRDYYSEHGIKNIVLPAGTEFVLEGEDIILKPSESYFDIESYSP